MVLLLTFDRYPVHRNNGILFFSTFLASRAPSMITANISAALFGRRATTHYETVLPGLLSPTMHTNRQPDPSSLRTKDKHGLKCKRRFPSLRPR